MSGGDIFPMSFGYESQCRVEIYLNRTPPKTERKNRTPNRRNCPVRIYPHPRLLKKLRRIFRVSEKQSLKHFVSGRVPDTKYFSGCKCTSCAPTAHKECAQQTAKNWRKRPQAFFDKLNARQHCWRAFSIYGYLSFASNILFPSMACVAVR